MYLAYTKSISLKNRKFHFDLDLDSGYTNNTIILTNQNVVNNRFYKVNLQNYSFDGIGIVVFNYNNYEFPTIRECSRTVTKVFSGYESIMNFRTLNAIIFKTSANISINIKGVPETEKIIKNIFDHLPDYFASFEEETED